MPIVTMNGKQIEYITTTEAANEYAKAMTDKIQGKEMVCYGLDAAWCRGDAANSTPLFQFSSPEGDAVILLHLPIMHDFPKNKIKIVLEFPNLVACRHQIHGDVSGS